MTKKGTTRLYARDQGGSKKFTEISCGSARTDCFTHVSHKITDGLVKLRGVDGLLNHVSFQLRFKIVIVAGILGVDVTIQTLNRSLGYDHSCQLCVSP